jgi:hypothetical protein
VRDLWLASIREKWLSLDEHLLLNNILDLVDDGFFLSLELQSLSISLAPTRNRRVMRFVEHLDQVEMDQEVLECVAQVAVAGKERVCIYAVWVDARDLSYHNFECILPLDRALHMSGDMELEMVAMRRVKEGMDVYVGKLVGRDVEMLKKLDELGLYQQPPNSASRGGERFIFSSSVLSSTLTAAVKASGVLSLMKATSEEDFEGVNSVFRCNRFAPGARKFNMHMDTPYYDESRGQISKFTLLIYITGGRGDPALQIGSGGLG